MKVKMGFLSFNMQGDEQTKKHENKISYVIDMFRFLTSLSSNLLSAM